MRRLGVVCGLIAGAVLLVPLPEATADVPVSTPSSDSQAVPHTEVSMLAVSLAVGGALVMAGSGLVLVLTRRRALDIVCADQSIGERHCAVGEQEQS